MIFFDLDDTLLDHNSAARAGAAKFYETFRSDFDEELESFLVRWETVAEKYFQSNNSFPYSLLEQRRMRMRDIFSTPPTDEEADARFQIYLDAYELNWRLYPDSISCLKTLQDHKLGLITNGESEQQRSKIQKLGLGPYLSTIIISREVDCAKPEKAIFELAAKQAGVNVKDCLYVGDRLQTDALSCQKAGMKGIWLDRQGKGVDGEFEITVIRSLMELPGLLQ
jgi:putative hydrolase of the HAD superfamily